MIYASAVYKGGDPLPSCRPGSSFSRAVRQPPLIIKSMRNTTLPVRPHVGTGIYHIGSLQERPHTICDPLMVPLLVAFYIPRRSTLGAGYSTIVTPASQGSLIRTKCYALNSNKNDK
jgi:hypothetical protein